MIFKFEAVLKHLKKGLFVNLNRIYGKGFLFYMKTRTFEFSLLQKFYNKFNIKYNLL